MMTVGRTGGNPILDPKDAPHARIPTRLRWSLADVDFSKIDRECIEGRDDMFLLVCSASFMESSSETFTRNLLDYFADDGELGPWLSAAWEPEELQHGRALKTYVQHVWPAFDWDGAYSDFFAEYAKLCTADALEPTHGQEMVARCIVEMGTTTFYQALSAMSEESVLRDLTWRIRTDEVQHYKHFYRSFLRYREQEQLHRSQVMATIWRRVVELRQSDADVALRHAAAWYFREDQQAAAQSVRQVFARMATQYPIELGVRMALKPLLLPAQIQRWVERPLAAVARWQLLH